MNLLAHSSNTAEKVMGESKTSLEGVVKVEWYRCFVDIVHIVQSHYLCDPSWEAVPDKLGIALSRLLLMLLVRLSMAVCPSENCRCPRSSASFSTTLLVSRSGVDRSRNRRWDEMDGRARRDVMVDDRSRRRGSAEALGEAVSIDGMGCWAGCSRGMVLNPATSVAARDGARNRELSSSSSFVPFRGRRSNDDLRPSSGSSVPARRVLRNVDFRPDCSSGSSVPARRVRETSNDDLRPAASEGAFGERANRGVAIAGDINRLDLLSSTLVAALGLVADFGMASSVGWGGRRTGGRPAKVLLRVGLRRGVPSFSRGVETCGVFF